MPFHIAELNIARMRGPLDSPVMADFLSQLAEINALADRSDGFVWRLQTEAGDSTTIRPYGDEPILVNMSVWESLEHLQQYIYRSAHVGVMRDRKQWFEKYDGAYYVLWWLPAGSIPTIREGVERLDYLREHGESEHAFSFRKTFPSPDNTVE
jgi:hypothetical protein